MNPLCSEVSLEPASGQWLFKFTVYFWLGNCFLASSCFSAFSAFYSLATIQESFFWYIHLDMVQQGSFRSGLLCTYNLKLLSRDFQLYYLLQDFTVFTALDLYRKVSSVIGVQTLGSPEREVSLDQGNCVHLNLPLHSRVFHFNLAVDRL